MTTVRILHIGNSHTVGTYGRELHRLLQNVGAEVNTYGSSGSGASSWLRGYTAKTTAVPPGIQITPDGSEDITPSGSSYVTPLLKTLIDEHKPDIVLISLGANMRWMKEPAIAQDMKDFITIAKNKGAKLVWVGPPPQKDDMVDRSKYLNFNKILMKYTIPNGKFILSSPFIKEYAGTDGLHFNTPDGENIAKSWAKGVFDVMTTVKAKTPEEDKTDWLTIGIWASTGMFVAGLGGGVIAAVGGWWLSRKESKVGGG
jgi:lysophospholipase L1-like esterase